MTLTDTQRDELMEAVHDLDAAAEAFGWYSVGQNEKETARVEREDAMSRIERILGLCHECNGVVTDGQCSKCGQEQPGGEQ